MASIANALGNERSTADGIWIDYRDETLRDDVFAKFFTLVFQMRGGYGFLEQLCVKPIVGGFFNLKLFTFCT